MQPLLSPALPGKKHEFTEGSVLIDVDVTSPARPKVTTRSTRQGEISRAITGQSADSPLPKTLIESLYALCPQAHLAAFECAMAAAQQKGIPQRSRKVVYEIINEHLRFLAFDACVSVGIKPGRGSAPPRSVARSGHCGTLQRRT